MGPDARVVEQYVDRFATIFFGKPIYGAVIRNIQCLHDYRRMSGCKALQFDSIIGIAAGGDNFPPALRKLLD